MNYIPLIIFLIVWNIFIKSLVFGFIWQLFGNRSIVTGKSYRELYQMKYDSQSIVQSLIWDSLLAPTVFYYLTYFIFF